MQRPGRSGRTHPGEYFRYNSISSSELPSYSEAPIEREMLDRYILILLSQGIHLESLLEQERQNQLDHDQLFFHKVNPELFKISLQRLKLLGALTKDGALTKM